LINNLKTLIILQIKQVYNNIKVYEEKVKQGLDTPAFLVRIIDNYQDRKLKGQVERSYTFNVTYIPETDDIENELDLAYETFQNEFQYVANLYHVHKLESVKENDTLIITFIVKVLLKESKGGLLGEQEKNI
jgi:hypothetical protein